jgi:serine/threonine protein kinase
VDHHDSVFGSIFYMAPEQFERGPLDSRADMYAIGCVYYFTLTGRSPFEGDTGPQVMAAHLDHRVIPLNVVRPDIPKWAADWVMWHINRYPVERPENARETLRTFIQLDVPMTQSIAPAAQPVNRAQMVTVRPGGPRPSRPEAVRNTVSVQLPPEQPIIPPLAPPQPLAPPEGAKPSLHVTSPQGLTEPVPAPDAPPPALAATVPTIALNPAQPQHPTGPMTGGPRMTLPAQRGTIPIMVFPTKKKGMTAGQKNALTAFIGVLILAAAYFVVLYMQKQH